VKSTRRQFVVGCSAAVAAMAGTRLSMAAFATEASAGDALVVVFLRGGMDGLSLLAPMDGPDRAHYVAARPTLALPAAGSQALLPLAPPFGLSPAAAELYPLYQDGRVAFVLACGLNHDTRSHFDAQEFMELGTPGVRSTATGWLTRHLKSTTPAGGPVLIPTLAVGGSQPASLRGDWGTVAMTSPDHFNLDTGPWRWRDAQRATLRRLCSGGGAAVFTAGNRALDAVDIVEAMLGEPGPPANGVQYPETEMGRQFRLIASLIKQDLGLRVATVDVGGWDTHVAQAWAPAEGWFPTLLGELSASLAALYQDLDGSQADALSRRLTVVVLSEFGRRVRENADRGTDHGHGNVMLLLGGNVVGGVHGRWPGLAPEQLYDGADLAITTDYRQVLAEVLVRRLGNPHLSEVFPGLVAYAPLGVVRGTDLPVD
jgi:uncharacterized protein (DUF1501 family)